MLYFTVDAVGDLVAVSEDSVRDSVHTSLCRWDFKTFADAEAMAKRASEFTGKTHLATDEGAGCSPRYDVIAAPTMGAEVSKGFNGDYYPCGKIVKISDSFKRIETDTGIVFFRRHLRAAWLNKGMWSMVAGVRKELNPSF